MLEELLDDESEMAGMCLSRSQAAVELSGNDVNLADSESCPLPPEEGCQVVAMDMGFEEISELEDMIEAYWLVRVTLNLDLNLVAWILSNDLCL